MLPIRDINPTRVFPIVTLLLIAANVAVFFLVQPFGDPESQEAVEFVYRHAAIACELTTGEPLSLDEINLEFCEDGGRGHFSDKNVWLAALVSMFLHGGFAHILFNMWTFWIFGNNVEEACGRFGFLLLYALAGIVATAGFVLLNRDSTIPLVGASGAIAGIMGAYVVLFPRHRVLTLVFFYLVAIPSAIFLAIWFATQFLLAGGDSNVAWEAHVFGFAFGVLVTLPLRGQLMGRTSEALQRRS